MNLKKNKQADLNKWYDDVVRDSKLIVPGLVKGTMLMSPYVTKLWENIQKYFNNVFSNLGVQNVQFPLLIPYNEFEKEAKHFQGFSPELGKITKVGDKDLAIPLAIRPTSEILFCHYFRETAKTYQELPLLLNQWCSVVRWEKNTKPFLRNSEFYWQEGHTLHASIDEARELTLTIFNDYQKFLIEIMNINPIAGRKTEMEKFAGAEETYTVEVLMPNGYALQCATSHYLGHNFTKAFNIKIQNKDNQSENPVTTSWGISTRIIGAMILVHGDDNGLVMPWHLAPYQVVIVNKDPEDNEVSKYINSIVKGIETKYSCFVDDKPTNLKIKLQNWELKGVPIVLEIGTRNLKARDITFKYRLNSQKEFILENSLISKIIETEKLHIFNLLNNHKEDLKLLNRIILKTPKDLNKVLENNSYGIGYFCLNDETERKIKSHTTLTIRCILTDSEKAKFLQENKGLNLQENCFYTNQPSSKLVIFAKSY